jgi:hypothetical protein
MTARASASVLHPKRKQAAAEGSPSTRYVSISVLEGATSRVRRVAVVMRIRTLALTHGPSALSRRRRWRRATTPFLLLTLAVARGEWRRRRTGRR